MKVNFRGLVELHSLPASEPLLPLYEAIVNSIQSIEDASLAENEGFIDISIERASLMSFGEGWETDVENIIIKDNGIGFTDENYNSFDTYASDFKLRKGCKGVGRIMWLKAFDNVKVDSVYSLNDELFKRKFNFSEKEEIHNIESEKLESSTTHKRITIISLNGLKSKFRKTTPARLATIARDILSHCFMYFITQRMPKIRIHDDADTICINDLYNEYKDEHFKTDDFQIGNNNFKLVHSKNYKFPNASSALNFCAHSRKVSSIKLSSILNNIDGKFNSEEGEFSYSGFIISPILDESVNRERTDFNIPEAASNDSESSEIGQKEIVEASRQFITEFLKEDIANHKKEKTQFFTDYIYSKNPRYRYLLKRYPEFIDNIPWIRDEEKLEIEIFKQEQAYRLLLKTTGSELEKEISNSNNLKDSLKKKSEYAGKISELGKSNLIEYILHRKTVLEILDNMRQYQSDGMDYAYEENIHQIIFPMRKTSDDIDYQSHNLWIIDEKLAYHQYLASDKSLKSISNLESESSKELDIIIFDKPFAFTDEDRQPFRNITIIEFKRPGKNNYADKDNPIQQVIGYMDEILSGKIKTRDGKTIEQNENIRFFCYIICDMCDKIKLYAKQKDFEPSPDGIGFYRYMNNYNALIEIIPYTKLIQGSKQRNKILFDKLFTQES